jgi:hypothetical protein
VMNLTSAHAGGRLGPRLGCHFRARDVVSIATQVTLVGFTPMIGSKQEQPCGVARTLAP